MRNCDLIDSRSRLHHYLCSLAIEPPSRVQTCYRCKTISKVVLIWKNTQGLTTRNDPRNVPSEEATHLINPSGFMSQLSISSRSCTWICMSKG